MASLKIIFVCHKPTDPVPFFFPILQLRVLAKKAWIFLSPPEALILFIVSSLKKSFTQH